MKNRIRWDKLALWFFYAFFLGTLLVTCFGCVHHRKPHWPAPQTQPAGPVATSAEETLSEKVHRLEGEVAAAKADLHYEQDRWLRYIATWSAGLCALAAIACAIAAVFLPVMKKRLTIGAVAFGVGVAISLTLRQSIPYLPWIGMGLVAIGIGATLPTFISHARQRLGG